MAPHVIKCFLPSTSISNYLLILHCSFLRCLHSQQPWRSAACLLASCFIYSRERNSFSTLSLSKMAADDEPMPTRWSFEVREFSFSFSLSLYVSRENSQIPEFLFQFLCFDSLISSKLVQQFVTLSRTVFMQLKLLLLLQSVFAFFLTSFPNF